MYKVPRSDQKLPPPQGWKWRVIGWFTLFWAISGIIYGILLEYPYKYSLDEIQREISLFMMSYGCFFGGIVGMISGMISSRILVAVSVFNPKKRLFQYNIIRVFMFTSVGITWIMSYLLSSFFTDSVQGPPIPLPPLYWSSVVLAAISAVIIAWLMLRWLERANMKTDEVDSQVALN